MDCSCVYIDNDNAPEIVTDTNIKKARKNHICSECSEIIKKGVPYEKIQGKWEGVFLTYKTCAHCQDVRTVFFCDGYTFGQIWPDLYEHIENCYANGDIDAILKDLPFLTPLAQSKVCDIIESIWDKNDD